MDEEFTELSDDAELRSSKTLALRILGRRSISSRELEKRLVSKEISPGAARQTAQWLESIGAINDKEYADSIVSHYSEKGYGFARIKDELYKRGIDRELWEEALGGAPEMEDSAYYYAVKRLDGGSGKDELRRVTEALCRRGFSYDEARGAVNRYLESIEESEGKIV